MLAVHRRVAARWWLRAWVTFGCVWWSGDVDHCNGCWLRRHIKVLRLGIRTGAGGGTHGVVTTHYGRRNGSDRGHVIIV